MILKGKNAIVTGANRGIGKAIVECFATEGANIWAFARRKDVEFENSLKELAETNGVWIEPVYFDLTNEKDMRLAIQTVFREKKSIDVLVNNAGICEYHPFTMTSTETMEKIMNTNYFAPLSLTQMISRKMGKGSTGSIIFLSSISGLRGEYGTAAYGGSKAAVAHAVKTLSLEFAKQNIRVNGVAPGMVDTDMKKLADEKTWNNLIQQVYLKREADPMEIANVVAFLASDKSGYIDGQIIRVDGGMQ